MSATHTPAAHMLYVETDLLADETLVAWRRRTHAAKVRDSLRAGAVHRLALALCGVAWRSS